MTKEIAFGWYGGKFSHLNWLLPLLPTAQHYCEPFGGVGSRAHHRVPCPCRDLQRPLMAYLVNFFRVLRDHKDDLVMAIGLTPFSREEFEIAIRNEDCSPLERARRFFVRARQVRTGLAQTASSGRWAHCLLTSRAGMAGAVSRWLGSVEGLSEIAQRLLRVQIENAPALEVIERYDSPDTLFYCDPPYLHESRGDAHAYRYEMTDDEHRALAAVLHHVKGKVAISGYGSALMNVLYGDWERIEASSKLAPSIKKARTEVLWINYQLNRDEQQTSVTKASKVKLL
ncbi:DNA adenine methylase [bacterium]|nr:DNA adenine methylase [bacterium]